MFCCTLFSIMVQWVIQSTLSQKDLLQDQMAVLQLRLDIAQCDTWSIQDGQLAAKQEKENVYYAYHNERLVKRPGYEIFMQGIEEAAFFKKGEKLYIRWKRADQTWQAKLAD